MNVNILVVSQIFNILPQLVLQKHSAGSFDITSSNYPGSITGKYLQKYYICIMSILL